MTEIVISVLRLPVRKKAWRRLARAVYGHGKQRNKKRNKYM